MASSIAKVSAMDIMKDMTLEVKVYRVRELRIRLWLATRLVLLAAWIAGCGVQITEVNNADCT